jgi:hypothetical protein
LATALGEERNQARTLVGRQPERIGQRAKRVRVRAPGRAELQATYRARGQARPLGECLLAEASAQAELPQLVTEGLGHEPAILAQGCHSTTEGKSASGLA